MKKSKIINYLKLITDELKDALSDEDITAWCSVSTAQELVDELIDNLQGKADDDDFLDKYCEKHPDFNDAMNGLYK